MVVSNIFGIFTPKNGEDFHFDEHIFQMGWFNHQPGNVSVEVTWTRCIWWTSTCSHNLGQLGIAIGGKAFLQGRQQALDDILASFIPCGDDFELIVWKFMEVVLEHFDFTAYLLN